MPLRRVTPGNRDAVIAEAAAVLRRGGLVVIPTDTVYGVAAHPGHPAALQRLPRIKNRAPEKPIALLAADLAAVTALGAKLSPAARHLARKYWPGPLTLVLPTDDKLEGFRIPDHNLARRILSAAGGVLRVTSANLSNNQPAITAHEAQAALGYAVDLIVDAGRAPGGQASTVAQVVNDRVDILRTGGVPAADIMRTARVPRRPAPHQNPPERSLLFVCSGNTCRSPMAEYLLRARLPLGTPWRVASAGTSTGGGQPAAETARRALQEVKVRLGNHTSRPLTRALAETSDLIITMARHHLDLSQAMAGDRRGKVSQLRRFAPIPDGADIADPAGGLLQDYRDCRDAIIECLPGLLRRMAELESGPR